MECNAAVLNACLTKVAGIVGVGFAITPNIPHIISGYKERQH